MDPRQVIEFMRFAEGLKNVLRHSVTSEGRRVSVAEHSWMLCLLAMVLFDEVALEVDQLKVLKMLIIHDMGEIVTGDIPTFDKERMSEADIPDEFAAMRQLVQPLSPAMQTEILTLFEEYEHRESNEARLAYAIDKAEAMIQHNIADIASWTPDDYAYQTDLENRRHQHIETADPYMAALKAAIDRETLEKISAAGQLQQANPILLARHGQPE